MDSGCGCTYGISELNHSAPHVALFFQDYKDPHTVCCTAAYIQQQCTLSFYWRWHYKEFFSQFTVSSDMKQLDVRGFRVIQIKAVTLNCAWRWSSACLGCISTQLWKCLWLCAGQRQQALPAASRDLDTENKSASLIWQTDFWLPARPASACFSRN